MRHYPVYVDLRDRTRGGVRCRRRCRREASTADEDRGAYRVYGAEPVRTVPGLDREGRIVLVERNIEPSDAAGAVLVYGANGDAARTRGRQRSAARRARSSTSSTTSRQRLHHAGDRRPRSGHGRHRHRGCGAGARTQDQGRGRGNAAGVARDARPHRPVVPRPRRGAGIEGAPRASGPASTSSGGPSRWKRARKRPEGGWSGCSPKAMSRARLRPPGRRRPRRSGTADPEGAQAAARGRCGDPRPSGAVGGVGARPPRGDDPRGRQDGLRAVLDAGRINALVLEHARAGATVVRLKGGDPAVFGRLDEEIEALEAAGVGYSVVPGVTSASAAAAAIGQSLTRRGRNSSFRVLTGHDVDGFAEHDWRELARPGRHRGDLHGSEGRHLPAGPAADARGRRWDTSQRSRTQPPRQRVIATTLIDLPKALAEAAPEGPVMLLYGLAPAQRRRRSAGEGGA